jgi:hypothetical protein
MSMMLKHLSRVAHTLPFMYATGAIALGTGAARVAHTLLFMYATGAIALRTGAAGVQPPRSVASRERSSQ